MGEDPEGLDKLRKGEPRLVKQSARWLRWREDEEKGVKGSAALKTPILNHKQMIH